MSWSRIGTGLLALAGLVVAALMGYAALFAGWRPGGGPGRDGGDPGSAGDLPYLPARPEPTDDVHPWAIDLSLQDVAASL